MASAANAIGSDTADACWLCDREGGELCHVHGPRTDDDSDPAAVVVSLSDASELPS